MVTSDSLYYSQLRNASALVASGTVLRPVLVGASYPSGVQSSQMKSCFIVFGHKQISNFAMPCDHIGEEDGSPGDTE